MSFKEYVHHISQKYRLAVAISVIKTKPNNLSIDEYLLHLQNKIKDQDFDPNETVCSDDFNFDDDDILNEKNENNTEIYNKCDKLNEHLDFTSNENDSQGSQTILNDFVFGADRIEHNAQGEVSIGDTLRLLKEVSAITQGEPNEIQNLSQLTFCESQEAVNKVNDEVTRYYATNTNAIEDNNIIYNANDNNNIDTQETQLYSLHGFTQDYTHVSQTQNEYFVIADKYIRSKANNTDNVQRHNNLQDNVKVMNEQTGLDMQIYHNVSQKVPQNILVITNEGTGERDNNLNSNNIAQYTANVENSSSNTQSFPFNDEVSEQFKTNKHDAAKGDKSAGRVVDNIGEEIETTNVDKAQRFQLNVHNNGKFKANYNETSATIMKDRLSIYTGTNLNGKDPNIANCTPLLSLPSQKTVVNDFTPCNEIPNINIEHKHDSHKIIQEPEQSTQNNQQNLNNDHIVDEVIGNIDDDAMELDETGSDDNTQETVPFKVIEELNRVKNFVTRKSRKYDGYSTDSGYRSDSQPRSSLKTLSQQSGAWVNQSAYCLFNHILHATATDDIVKEIAQVLGKLIDKLHDEENYPPFLEELLETVDKMLMEIRHGGGCADVVLITKDETIHRLILLNKSKHILKYSIEKITTILEQLHINLTQENIYELTNIVEMENSCYIFHILEILIKKYMKVKDVSSQSTQNSQEESLPTRSSLTELWRKKWYPNYNKEIIKNDNKVCVLKRCSEVLNKIIVECMDGYSLVVFAALQCFNLMQA